MRVVIAGSSGLIGTALASALREESHQIVRLVRRRAAAADEFSWDPASGLIDSDALRGADVIISLGGASVGRLPWTARYRRALWNSRIDSTRTIVKELHSLEKNGEAPVAFLSASASGFYGSEAGETLTEQSPVGDTFLARLCAAWEAAALQASDVTRVALLRTSPILHPEGVLKPMMLLTRFGLGGPLGNGGQVWPWISLEDEVRGILHVIEHEIDGPVNLAGPVPATNADIGRALAKEMHRPFLLPAPAFALRAAVGRDAAESLLLADAHVQPRVLQDAGFIFNHPTVGDAIKASAL